MFNKLTTVQECDATMLNGVSKVRYKKGLLERSKINHHAKSFFMKNTITVLITCLLISVVKTSVAQTAGDYRSKQSGAWNIATSWQTYNGSSWADAVSSPTSSNGITTILSGHVITSSATVTVDQVVINSGGTLNITAANFTIANGAGTDLSCSGTLALSSNATLGGSGICRVLSGGIFNWTGGTVGGGGSLTINAGGSLNMSGINNHFLADSSTLNNAGTWTWTGGDFYFYNGKAVVNNTRTFNISTDADVKTTNSSAAQFNNQSTGIINKIGNPWEETSFAGFSTFTNAGKINVNSSKINIGVNSTNTGLVNVLFGATIRFTGTSANTTNFTANNLTGTGIASFEGQVVNVTAPAAMPINTINVSAGTVNMNRALVLSSGKALNLSGGTFNTDSIVTFQSGSTLNWTGGTFGGAGKVNVSAGSVFNISGGNHFLNNTITVNDSTATTWTGTGNLYFNTGTPAFNNFNKINIYTDADVLNSAGITGTFSNKPGATINKLGSVNGETFFGGLNQFDNRITFNNDGVVNINSGNINISGAADYTGDFNVAFGSTLHFSGFKESISHFNAGSGISGAGTVSFDGPTLVFNASSDLTVPVITLNNGFLTLVSGLTRTSGTSFNFNNGTINGKSAISFESGSVFNWSNGTISDSGTVNINEGAVFNMYNNDHYLIKKTLNNYGTWNWTGGSLQLGDPNPVANNYGTLNISTDADAALFYTGTFTNRSTGIINKTGASNGETSFGNTAGLTGNFNNQGVININSGNLGIYYNGAESGTYNIAAGAGLRVDNFGLYYTGSTFTNNGTVTCPKGFIFGGPSQQSLNGTGSMDNLEINNSNGITLGGTQTISNQFKLTNGRALLGNNDLILGTAALLSGGSATSYVVTNGTGSLQRRVLNNNAVVPFPVGHNNSYMPANIQLTAVSTSDDFKVRVMPNIYAGYNAGNNPRGNAITANVVNGTWLISELVASGSDATIKLQWNGTDEAPGFNRSTSRFGQYTSSAWILDTATAASGTGPYTLTKTGITSFGPFGIINQFVSCLKNYGTICRANAISVPYVAVGSFNAGNVFTAQLSNANGSFAAPVNIGTISSTTSGNINATIPGATALGSGYRVRVISNNPSTTGPDNASNITINSCANIIAGTNKENTIESENMSGDKLLVYPNPTNGRITIDLKLKESKSGYANIQMMNMEGKVVFAEKISVAGNSINKTISFSNAIQGIYMMKLTVGNNVYYQKIVYQK